MSESDEMLPASCPCWAIRRPGAGRLNCAACTKSFCICNMIVCASCFPHRQSLPCTQYPQPAESCRVVFSSQSHVKRLGARRRAIVRKRLFDERRLPSGHCRERQSDDVELQSVELLKAKLQVSRKKHSGCPLGRPKCRHLPY